MNGFVRTATMAAALAMAIVVWPAFAIQLEKDPELPALHLSGDIETGDDTRFIRFLDEVAGFTIESVFLDSFGGDVMAAVGIGRTIKRLGLRTGVMPGKQCNSACFFIWAAGAARANHLGILGIHRPYFDAAYYAAQKLPGAEELAAELYAEAEAYLVEMEIPRPIIDKMLATPSTTLHVLTDAELRTIPASRHAFEE